jgi:CotH kinase protein
VYAYLRRKLPNPSWMASLPLLLGLALVGCGEDPEPRAAEPDAGSRTPSEPGPDLFDDETPLEVSVALKREDWDLIRTEGRDVARALTGCGDPDFAYTVVEASVTIGEQTATRIGVRKKGLLGSISTLRPSLILDFDEFVADQRLLGLRRMTLNNNRQDPTNVRQCLAYRVFRDAGVAAPRCAIAHLRVNGEDLGYFSHVEPIQKPFLERAFGDDSGNLYEGTGMDFTPELSARIEKKTNEREADFSDVEQLVAALQVDDDQLLSRLGQHLDVDRFLRFWALETLVGHWDGYTGNANNFFLYKDPRTDLFEFIPWGTDGAFREHGFIPDYPASRYVTTILPRRLYALAETREAYQTVLRELLDEVWDERSLLRMVDTIVAQSEVAEDLSRLAQLREFIEGRRAAIEADLEQGDDAWRAVSPFRLGCNAVTQPFRVEFATSWGDPTAYAPSSGNVLALDLSGQARAFELLLAAAGSIDDENTLGPVIRVLGNRTGEPFTVVQFSLPTAQIAPGRYPLHGFESLGIVGLSPTAGQFDARGLLTGELVLEQAAMEPGAPVVGWFEGTLVMLPEGLLDS